VATSYPSFIWHPPARSVHYRGTPSCPPPAPCLVSFTDSEGVRHSVEVAASTLYEAAALAIGEFRRCGFTADAPGPATRLTVTVNSPATSHEVRVSKVEAWIQSGGKSPSDQALKVRLRELLGLG
jgi:hypothetical protein